MGTVQKEKNVLQYKLGSPDQVWKILDHPLFEVENNSSPPFREWKILSP